jgi:sphinganine-1-phosphate aldolase
MNNNKLPKTGRSKDDILSALKEYGTQDPAYKDGRTWSLVYYLGEDHTSLLQDAYNMYFSANGLNPMAFKSLKQLESDIIRITADLLNGDENVCGVVTSGGTESCLLAVKTYRDYGKAKKRIKKPQMIIPETAHVAWEKGGEYFGVEILRAPLDKDYRVDVQAVKKMVTKNTIMILGSAPEYPHGIIDPIEELGQIASARVIPLHVDACVGGYILPFIEKLGTKFRTPDLLQITV